MDTDGNKHPIQLNEQPDSKRKTNTQAVPQKQTDPNFMKTTGFNTISVNPKVD